MNETEATSTAAKLPLTFACGLYDRMLRLYTGEVQPRGVDLKFLANDEPRDIFDRMGGKLEFDASENVELGIHQPVRDGPLPVRRHPPPVPARLHFLQPQGGNSYAEGPRRQARWRPALRHERCDLGSAACCSTNVASTFRKSVGCKAHSRDRARTAIRRWRRYSSNRKSRSTSGDSLSKLLADGEIDAVISSRPVEAIGSNPDIARLFPNYREVEKDYYRRTRIFPIMHLIVIRRDVHEAHPFVAQSLYDALCESKDRALALMKERGALRYMLPWLPADMDEIDDVFGGDPWPYGVEANRPTLEALVQYMVEQHFIAERIPIEALFVVGR